MKVSHYDTEGTKYVRVSANGRHLDIDYLWAIDPLSVDRSIQEIFEIHPDEDFEALIMTVAGMAYLQGLKQGFEQGRV